MGKVYEQAICNKQQAGVSYGARTGNRAHPQMVQMMAVT